MFGASPFTLLKRKQNKIKEDKKIQQNNLLDLLQKQQPVFVSDSESDSQCQDLNVFVVTFQKMKQTQKQLSGGDPYQCKNCSAYLNSYSKVLFAKQLQQNPKLKELKIQLKSHQSLWICEFCQEANVLNIQKEQIPKKQDVVYMMESQHQKLSSEDDQTMVFCIDVSGSMNTTSQVNGKIDLKFGISQEEIEMLKQFMQPGDEAQFNWLPGVHNQNKTFVSRKQCILSAIESHLQEIKKSDPMKKIGFVTFNNQVTIFGDKNSPTVNIVGDKLYNKNIVIESLKQFKLTQPLSQTFEFLINSLNKTEAKGQTALGPALVSAIQVASKGTLGSSVYLCTDGLSNIGMGALDPLSEESRKFYEQLAEVAKQKNLSVNIMTIKGQGCKMQVIGKLAEKTHGNMKVVNPEKLAEDFANVLKDQVLGVNVDIKIMLHKAMEFRKQDKLNLRQNGRILLKQLPNATANSKVSFEYQLKSDQLLQQLKIRLQQLKQIPFQAQIQYTSPKGGRFLRVVTSINKATTIKDDIKKQANLGVVHQRITSQTAALYSKGQEKKSQKFNNKWSNFLHKNFKGNKQYEKKQQKFQQKNTRLQKAIKHKIQKHIIKQQKQEKYENQDDQLNDLNKSIIDSDEDQAELMDNLMEKQNYSFVKSDNSDNSF